MRLYPHIYSQRDPKWVNQRLGTQDGATIGQYGCLLSCFAMKACYYDYEINPAELDNLFTSLNIYINNDLLSDDAITKIYPDIRLLATYDYTSTPADLSLLRKLALDDTHTVTIELDFDHDLSDGIQTHFVELQSCDGTNLTIIDPWYGTVDPFFAHYGYNPQETIVKFSVYSGTPKGGANTMVQVEDAKFTELVRKSTCYDDIREKLGVADNADVMKAEVDKLLQLETALAQKDKDLQANQAQMQEVQQKAQDLSEQLLKIQKDNDDLTLQNREQAQDIETLRQDNKAFADKVAEQGQSIVQLEQEINTLKSAKTLDAYSIKELFSYLISRIFRA